MQLLPFFAQLSLPKAQLLPFFAQLSLPKAQLLPFFAQLSLPKAQFLPFFAQLSLPKAQLHPIFAQLSLPKAQLDTGCRDLFARPHFLFLEFSVGLLRNDHFQIQTLLKLSLFGLSAPRGRFGSSPS